MAWVALIRSTADLTRLLVCCTNRLCIALHGGRKLFHAGSSLLQVGSLLFRAIGQRPAVHGYALARMGHERGITADVGHHGREGLHHAVQPQCQIGQFVMPRGFDLYTQIALGCFFHGSGQGGKVARQAGVQRCQQVHQRRHANANNGPLQARTGLWPRHAGYTHEHRHHHCSQQQQFARQTKAAHQQGAWMQK